MSNLSKSVSPKDMVPNRPTASRPPFWESPPGLIIRWLGFLPCALAIYIASLLGVTWITFWLMGDSLKDLFIGVFAGALIPMVMFGWLVGVLCQVFVARACPAPYTGGVIFATLIVFQSLGVLVGVWMEGQDSMSGLLLLTSLVFAGAVGACWIKPGQPSD